MLLLFREFHSRLFRLIHFVAGAKIEEPIQIVIDPIILNDIGIYTFLPPITLFLTPFSVLPSAELFIPSFFRFFIFLSPFSGLPSPLSIFYFPLSTFHFHSDYSHIESPIFLVRLAFESESNRDHAEQTIIGP